MLGACPLLWSPLEFLDGYGKLYAIVTSDQFDIDLACKEDSWEYCMLAWLHIVKAKRGEVVKISIGAAKYGQTTGVWTDSGSRFGSKITPTAFR